MKQDAKGQVPGIDLAFSDNRTGRIWGTAGVDDLRAGSFRKALESVRRRAEQQQVFDWEIEISLEHVVSTAFFSLAAFVRGLDDVVKADEAGQRLIKIRWLIRAQNLSLQTLARDLREEATRHNSQVIFEIVLLPETSVY